MAAVDDTLAAVVDTLAAVDDTLAAVGAWAATGDEQSEMRRLHLCRPRCRERICRRHRGVEGSRVRNVL